VIAADGRLVLPDETAKGGVNWRQRAYAAQRHGKVPDGKRLVVSRGREGFVIELMDGPDRQRARRGGNPRPGPTDEIPPRRPTVPRPHRSPADLTQGLPRALRIIHALALEIERRRHQIERANAPQTDRYGRRERNAKDSTHLVVTIKDYDLELRIYEKGVGLRSLGAAEGLLRGKPAELPARLPAVLGTKS
jgi:hypothetical protein